MILIWNVITKIFLFAKWFCKSWCTLCSVIGGWKRRKSKIRKYFFLLLLLRARKLGRDFGNFRAVWQLPAVDSTRVLFSTKHSIFSGKWCSSRVDILADFVGSSFQSIATLKKRQRRRGQAKRDGQHLFFSFSIYSISDRSMAVHESVTMYDSTCPKLMLLNQHYFSAPLFPPQDLLLKTSSLHR